MTPDLFTSDKLSVSDGSPSEPARNSGEIPPATPVDLENTPEPKNSMAAKAAAYFYAHPNVWIDGQLFSGICGCYAWRTRLSDLRRAPLSMTVENRQRREGRRVISEYRYVPSGGQS